VFPRRRASYHARIDRIEKSLERLTRRQAEMQQQTLTLLRLLTIAKLDTYPAALTTRRFRIASQNEEDGITCALLQELGAPIGRFVEIGAGRNGGNSGFLASELNFEGLMVDQNAKALERLEFGNGVHITDTWVTAENINELITEHGLAGEIDLFSLDIDGNDYWVWKAMTACNPRIVILEYNSLFGADRSVTIPYDPKFAVTLDAPHRHAYYYGASIQALTKLGKEKGYRLVALEPRGVNVFFLREDLAPHIPACDPAAVYLQNRRDRLLFTEGFDAFEAAKAAGREIVEI
jgi:hypothetical protein